MGRYIAESNIKKDGTWYSAGDEIELTEEQAAQLPVHKAAAPPKPKTDPKKQQTRSSNSRKAGR